MKNTVFQDLAFWFSDLMPLVALLMLALAVYTDLRVRIIPNRLTIGLLVCFFVFAIIEFQTISFVEHVMWGSVALLGLLPFFACGKIGGGDVKLLSTVVLWVGPLAGFEYLVLTTLIGGGMALAVLSPGYSAYGEWLENRFIVFNRIVQLPTRNSLPYGVAISIAGCVVITREYIL